MALTTPPLVGLLALAACRLKGMRLAALVQDLYPDVGVALGTFREGSLATRLLDRLNRAVLSRADRVIVLGDCMRERVAAVISSWAGDPAATRRMGAEARALFLRRFDRPHAVEAYAESLLKCLAPSHAAAKGARGGVGGAASGLTS